MVSGMTLMLGIRVALSERYSQTTIIIQCCDGKKNYLNLYACFRWSSHFKHGIKCQNPADKTYYSGLAWFGRHGANLGLSVCVSKREALLLFLPREGHLLFYSF